VTAAKLSREEEEVACREYERGKSIRQLAATFRYCYSGMHSLLLRNGVTLRPRGGSKRKHG
jgi:hypothetical protein